MPTAGDEGYEKLVKCPYDMAHEIRKGRMQFHLEKCRRNFPMSQLVDCPYNKGHLVPKQELSYHMEEECDSRATWDRFANQGPVECPVKDLVPVNAATVPDGDENWDNFEASGSVLNHIKNDLETRPIPRSCQTQSKAKRKAHRVQERRRIDAILEEQKEKSKGSTIQDDSASVCSNQEPLPKPRRQPNVSVVKQDPSKAVAAIQKQFRTLDLNMKPSAANVAPSETSSMVNGPPSEFEGASTSRQMPFSYAAASRTGAANRPSSGMSNLSTGNSSTSMMTALTSHRAPNSTVSRPSTAMSDATTNSYATASLAGSAYRPPSAMSNSSVANSTVSSVGFHNDHRPPNSTSSRPSTAMSIAASATSYNQGSGKDGFCQIPIPGLGRGRRKPVQ